MSNVRKFPFLEFFPNSVFGKQMHSVTEVFIASPSLMALAMFSGTLGHGRGTW